MKALKIWFLSILTILILGFTAYAVYISQKQITNIVSSMIAPLSLLIHVLIICIIILLIAITGLSIVFAIVYIYRHFNKFEISEVGQHGSVIIRGHKHVIVNPYIATEVKEIKAKQEKALEVKPNVPTLRELLVSGYITSLLKNATMLFGFNQETLEERTGDISDTRTLGVLGKSRSGKTVHMFFLILQYVLSGGIVYLVDRAWNKPSSLYKLLLPLIETGYIKVARKPNEIVDMVNEFSDMANKREDDENINLSETHILVIDEFTSFARDKAMMKQLALIVHRTANELSGFNAYAIIGGQNISASLSGGNALINSIHSWFCFKVDYLESKRILSRKYATLTEKLKVGYGFFRDTSDTTEGLITPLGTVEDSQIALAILQGKFIAGSKVSQLYNPFSYAPTFQPYNPKLLDTVKEQKPSNLNPIPPLPQKEDTISIVKHQSSDLSKIASEQNKKEKLQETISYGVEQLSRLPYKPSSIVPDLVSDDKQIRVTANEQKLIQEAIDVAIQKGKVKGNGKVVRTFVRDLLNYDNRQYQKIQIYCDEKNY